LGNRFSQVCPQVAGATWYIKRSSFKNRALTPPTTIKNNLTLKFLLMHSIQGYGWKIETFTQGYKSNQIKKQSNQVGDRHYCPMND
jgi:hypothetical protein